MVGLYMRASRKGCKMISLDVYFKDFLTGKDRREVYKDEWQDSFKDNAIDLLIAVTGLFDELGIDKNKRLTSGWRPASINNKTANAAKASLHMICKAGDWEDDKNQTTAKLIASRPDLLKKHGLWLENPQYTKGNQCWVHLDRGTRQDRPSRQFNP